VEHLEGYTQKLSYFSLTVQRAFHYLFKLNHLLCLEMGWFIILGKDMPSSFNSSRCFDYRVLHPLEHSIIFSLIYGVRWVDLVRCPLLGLVYQPRTIDEWRIRWNENWQKKPKYTEETSPSSTSSTTNPTSSDSGSTPGRHGGKQDTNRLGYSTA
jgi:hypothetical protein